MRTDLAINVQNISKSYRRYHHPVDRFKELILPGRVKAEEFLALSNVTFQVNRGESVGILGQNGAGKSTLLQIITQTLTPTTGYIEVSGRISALLELGSGFNPDFTGRENVMVNGRILGFSKREIESKLEEIINFADIGDFIEQPVHTYSSKADIRPDTSI
jgi:lipopolysaccharide transport system ATP-binding protein